MLEHYYKAAKSLARLRSNWTGAGLERFAVWLDVRRSKRLTGREALRQASAFCTFALGRGARRWKDLPAYLPAFLRQCRAVLRRKSIHWQSTAARTAMIRARVAQFLAVNVPGYARPKPPLPLPFRRRAPDFPTYITQERGLSPATIDYYLRYLRDCESFLRKRGPVRLSRVCPEDIDAFVEECSQRWGTAAVRTAVYVLRVFVRYLRRERVLARDFSGALRGPIIYRLSSLPYSITWEEVGRLLRSVNPRNPGARRDRAILLLLACYGPRAAEVARLQLEDIDWRAGRLATRKRKSGNSTIYPLSTVVGNALLDYIKFDRPKTAERQVFHTVQAPIHPTRSGVIQQIVRHHLMRAKIRAPHMGAHLLRHTCVQRLVDSGFSLKVVGDYVGHRSVASTEVYNKVNLKALRRVAVDHGEEAL